MMYGASPDRYDAKLIMYGQALGVTSRWHAASYAWHTVTART
jgi:hypothetical protein